jgi:hypothetical protein
MGTGKVTQAKLPDALSTHTQERIYSSPQDLTRLSNDVQHLLRGRDTLDPKFYLASVAPRSWIPKVVVITRVGEVAGVVYAKERKIAGIPTGLVFIDTALDTILTDNSLTREELVEKAVNRLFENRRIRGLRLFIPPDAAEHRAVQSVVASKSLEGCYADINHHAFLGLAATYPQFLQAFGKHSRRNFRYYRRGFEAAGGQYTGEMTFEEFRRAAVRLGSKHVVGANAEGLDRALNMLATVQRPLLTGLRLNGEYISVLGGWHEPDKSTVFVQLNDDRDYPKMSLSVVLRAYLIEELIGQGVRKLLFWAGMGEPYLSQGEFVSTICASVDRSGLVWRTVRRLVGKTISWAPLSVAAHLRWIVPNTHNPNNI